MKIIIDDKIPFIQGVFEPFAEVVYLPGANITSDHVQQADALIVRTRTQCNEQLLSGSKVKFIATATIGYDHIDTAYCQKAGIQWTNAPGCNSSSVMQYIASALMVLSEKRSFTLQNTCIGIVGVGNVGAKVARLCELLGMKVLLNDPPRQRTEGAKAFVSLKQIMEEADIISLHVPLNELGEDATFHLLDKDFFGALTRNPIIINSCRGEVMDTQAAIDAITKGQISDLVCDCWENEPHIHPALLQLCTLATPHIAGYSSDGKALGTTMTVQALSRFYHLDLNNWQAMGLELPQNPTITIDGHQQTEQSILAKAILATYDIRNDDVRLRQQPELFEFQRGNYPVRREFPSYSIQYKNLSQQTLSVLKALGFNVNSSN